MTTRQMLRGTAIASAYDAARFVWNNGLKYRHIARFKSIPGYLTVREAKALYDAASQLPSMAPVVVEIGSHLGRSSFVLAKALKRTGGGVLHCIDPFDASGDASAAADYKRRRSDLRLSLLDQFRANMRRRGVGAFVKPMPGLSHEVAKSFDAPMVDMVFIDGDHDYSAVRRDFDDWVPKLPKGGIVALHDVFATPFDGHYDGPWRVVQESVVNNPDWKWFRLIDTLALAEKC